MQKFKMWLANQVQSVEPSPEFLDRSKRVIEVFVREEVQKRTDWNRSYWHYWKITLAGLGISILMIPLIRVVPVEAAPYNWWYPVDEAWDSLRLNFTRDTIDYTLLSSSLLQERVKEWKAVLVKESISQEEKKEYFNELETKINNYLEIIIAFNQDNNQPEEIKSRLMNESKKVFEEWQQEGTSVPESTKNLFDRVFSHPKEEESEFLYNAPLDEKTPTAQHTTVEGKQLPHATLMPSALRPPLNQFRQQEESTAPAASNSIVLTPYPRPLETILPLPSSSPMIVITEPIVTPNPITDQQTENDETAAPNNVSCSEEAQLSPMVLSGRGSLCATVVKNQARAIVKISRGQASIKGKGTVTIKEGSLFSLKGYEGIDTSDIQLPITVSGEGEASVAGDSIIVEVVLESGELSTAGNGTIELQEGWGVGYQRLDRN